MGKVVKAVAIIGAIAVQFVPGVGLAVGLAAFNAGLSVSAASAVMTGIVLAGASAALSVAASAFAPKPSAAQLGRLGLTFDPDTPRKILFGTTAGATDVLYTEPEGTDQEYINYVIAVAAHEVAGIETIYIDNKLFWSAAGGIASPYTGYATVTARPVGTAANAITISGGATWNASNCRLTGCAYLHVRLKRTGNSKKSESPFSGGISGRWTIECRGAKVYDPRLDSTRGGSGSHRADDQTTWDYTGGNNHALQALSFIIGYRINSVVSVGVGYPVDRIDYADWITAANICDEAVSVTGGGTQKRYEGGGVFADNDSPASVLASLCTHMNAELRDVNGKIGIRCAVNDFSGTLPALTADDVLGEFTWTGFSPLNDSFDTVKGKYTDPSTASLYQSTPYTPEALASSDIPGRRIFALDLPLCQDPTRAQRIARQVLRREQYRGTFTANFGPRAWAYPVGSVVTLTFGPAGLTAVKFRIVSQGIKIIDSDDAAKSFCPMALQVEDASIYTWAAGDAVTPPVAVAPVSYDALNGPFVLGIDEAGETAEWPLITGAGKPDDDADVTSANQVVVSAPSLVVYDATYTGTIIGSLSNESVRVARGGTSIKLDNGTSYAITINGGITATIDNTNGSGTKGDIIPTAFAGNFATIDVVVTVAGIAQPKVTITFQKNLAAPPASGGSGSKVAYDTALTSISATTDTVMSDTLTVTIASGESLYGSAPLDYEVSGTTTATRTASVKWQYSVAGANSWSDFVASTYVTGTAAQSGKFVSGEWIDPVLGFVSASQSKSGLSAGDYDVRLAGKLDATGRTMAFFGTATVEAKV